MQLLIKRGQHKGMGGKPVFDLWVQFELTLEEQGLIHKYGVQNFILSYGNVRRDVIKSILYAWILSIFVLIISSFTFGISQGIELSFLIITLGSYTIYHRIRETIKVQDILEGRTFACGSVIGLFEKQDTLAKMALEFRRFLEATKTWGGKEVIILEPDKEPELRVIEQRHATG
jgi:hypothetical protein